MKNSLRIAALTLGGAVGLMLMTPTAAHASKQGRRNTALALGAVAAYGLVKKKPAVAGVAGAGAVYSWVRSNKGDDRDRRYWNRGRYRDDRYHDDYRYRGDRYRDYGYRDRLDDRYYDRSRGYYGRGRRCD
mgnify:CR=1 FL=1|jgi:uncharacterized protein YraI